MKGRKMIQRTFEGKIGIEVKGKLWTCVEWPGSKAILGTGKATKIKGTVDGHPIQTSLMPTGRGDHMLSLNKAILKAINKNLGDEVTIFIEDLV